MARKKENIKAQNAVIYARYSSAAQNDASIEQQIEACQAYADAHGISVIATYADHAISGRTDRRPEFQKMMRQAADRSFQIVIAYKSNRIARNMLHALAYEDKLAQYGISVVYCKEEFGNTAAGRFALRNMMNLNQFFSENLSEDVTRGMMDNARQCKVNGMVPFGYCKGEDGKYAVDPNTSVIVQEIFKRISVGELQASIADDLNARGIRTRTGGTWGKNSFHAILSNERYRGVYIFGDVRIENGIPAIIDDELFELARRRVETMKTAVKARRRREDVDYILTGKLYCGYCKEAMVGTCGTGHLGTAYYYYRCNQQAVDHTCHKKPVRKEWIEDTVVQLLKEYIFRDDVIEQIADLCMKYKRKIEEASEVGYLEDQLKDTITSKKNLLKAIEAGVITTTTTERLKELENIEKDLLSEISEAKKGIPNVDRADVIFWLTRFKNGDVDDPEYKRELIRNFLRSVYLYDDHLKLTFDFSEDDTGIDLPIEDDGADQSDEILIRDDMVYHTVLIRTPVNLKMVGRVFLLTAYFNQE